MFDSRWLILAALISSSSFAGVSFKQKQMRVQSLMKLKLHAPSLVFEDFQRELEYEKQGLTVEHRAKNETNLLADKMRQQIQITYDAALKANKSPELARVEIKAAIEKDLALMHMMAGWVERSSADGKRLKPREVIGEFDKYLHDELDLLREAASGAQLRRNMKGLDLVMIPEMIWDYCMPDVMVMERMKGVPIGQTQRLRDAGVDMQKLARDGVTIFFTQVFRDGYFHGDMHPGNIQVSLEPATFGRYISLDFGIVGTLTEVDKEYLAQNFSSFFQRDYKRVAELHIESGWVPSTTRVDELESAIRACCEPYFDRPLKEISLGLVLMRLFQTSRRFHVEIQPQLVLLQKTLLNIEGLGRELDPDLDLWSTAKPFLEKWMIEQIGPEKLLAQLKAEAPSYAKLLPGLPRLLSQYLKERPDSNRRELIELLAEQKRTNKLLQGIIYGGVGFLLGLVVMQVVMRVRLF